MISFCWLPPDKRARRQRRIRRAHVEALDDVGGAPPHLAIVHHHARRDRRPVVHAEDGVLVETEIEQQPAPMAVFGNVRDAALAARSRVEIR